MSQDIICRCEARGCFMKRLEDGTPGRIVPSMNALRAHEKDELTRQRQAIAENRLKDAQKAQNSALKRLEEEQLSDTMVSTAQDRSRAAGLIAVFSEFHDAARHLSDSLPPTPSQPFEIGTIPTVPSIEVQLDEVLKHLMLWEKHATDAKTLSRRLDQARGNFLRPDVRCMLDAASNAVQECLLRANRGRMYWEQAKQVLEVRIAESIPVEAFDSYDTARHFHIPMANANAIIQLTAYMVAACALVLRLPRRGGVWLLGMVALIVSECLRQFYATFHLPVPSHWVQFVSKFPKDVPTVIKHFNLGQTSTVYAACPSCSHLHPPRTDSHSRVSYPPVCRNRIGNRRMKRCKSQILRPKVVQGRTVLVPIKPFVYFDLRDWMAELLSRPGYEELMVSSWDKLDEEVDIMSDVYHGRYLKEFQWKDGKPYREPRDSTQSRYLLSLGFDFFNPLGNKQSGKMISVGVLVLACMNLPPQHRYKPENLFLSGIISGPHEPSISNIDNYFVPLVDQLLAFWDGVFFSRTYLYALGRLIVLALILLICDLRAARKLTGMADCSHTNPCSRCWCRLGTDIGLGSTNRKAWSMRTGEETRTWAFRHRDAPTEAAKNHIFAASGVRWSQFYRLPYFDLPNMLVVDPMHNLYLGLLMQHFRHILGYNPSEKEMQAAKRREQQRQEESSGQLHCNLPAICETVENPKPPRESPAHRQIDKTLDKLRSPMSDKINSEEKLLALAQKWKKLQKATLIYLVKGLVKSAAEGTCFDLALELLKWRSRQVETRAAPISPLQVHGAVLSSAETRQIWADIKNTTKPSWITSVPTIPGSAHGKLKADQWRMLGTLYLPITLIRLWSNSPTDVTNPEMQHKSRVLQLTMDLVCAVIIASSRIATKRSISHYEFYITRYLENLQILFPLYKPHPNHHMAMHVHEFATLFGPAHSWWCFPWERMIGHLQRLNTNYREGEYEQTIAFSYTEQANFRACMVKAPPIVQTATAIFKKLVGPSTRDSLSSDIKFFSSVSDRDDAQDSDDIDDTDVDCNFSGISVEKIYWEAFRTAGTPIPPKVVMRKALEHGGIRYMIRAHHQGNSQVLISNQEPAVIESIMIDKAQNVYIIVLPLVGANVEPDPYRDYPILNARLWSRKLAQNYRLISPADLGSQYAKCDIDWKGNAKLAVIISLSRTWLENVEDDQVEQR